MLRTLLLIAAIASLLTLSCTSGGSAPGSPAGPDNPRPDPQLLSQLEAQLDAQLAAQGGRGLSDVTGEYVSCDWTYDADAANVHWVYNNTGDYDQNSEVNASDLVPISINFNATSSDTNWPYAEVADGDHNGEVNFADVTPIGVNFGSVVTNYVVEAEIDGGPTWVPVANSPFGEGHAPMGGSIKEWVQYVPYGKNANDFRVYAGAEVPTGELYDLSTVTPSDPVVNVGNWSSYLITEGSQWGLLNEACLILDKPAIVYNNDDDKEIWYAGAKTANPASSADWVTMLVDDSATLGGPLDIVDFNEYPCITYKETNSSDVKFAYSLETAPSATGDWNSYKVEFLTSGFPSLAEAKSSPGIYMAFVGGGLGFAWTAGPIPPSEVLGWDESHVIESGPSFMFPELKDINQVPLIAYRNGDELCIAGADPFPIAADWSSTTLGPAQGGSESAGLRLIAGVGDTPVIAYRDDGGSANYKLKLALCPDGQWWDPAHWSFLTVAERYQAHIGIWPGLGLYNDRVLISYLEAGSAEVQGLHVAYALTETPTGPADFALGVLDEPDGYFVTGQTNVLILDDGNPAIIYRTSEGLKYAYYTPPS